MSLTVLFESMAMFFTNVMLVDWMKKSQIQECYIDLKAIYINFSRTKILKTAKDVFNIPQLFIPEPNTNDFFLAKTSFQQKFWLRLFFLFFCGAPSVKSWTS